jgi:hypothetical protein
MFWQDLQPRSHYVGPFPCGTSWRFSPLPFEGFGTPQLLSMPSDPMAFRSHIG